MASNYKGIIKKAKTLIKLIKVHELKIVNYQTEIVMFAIEACEIRHGGISPNAYTIKDFAADTGAPYRLLLNWSRVYRNVLLKNGITEPTAEQWAIARRVDLVFKNERSFINKANGKGGTKTAYANEIPEARVKEIYEEIEQKPFVYELEKLIASSKHIKFILSKRDLGIAQPQRLIELMENLDIASDSINDFLTPKKIRVVQ